ncbi:MAG TPA: hypothetical protein VGR57_22185 [Ktedonobacterales bacterium]|nr:hypothetical protein [Ktedonobacterales bacterium]
MKVKRLDITVYESDGWTWRTDEIRNPSWHDVEAAIRRLDRFRYPFVWLFLNAEANLFDDPYEFSVLGGEGEYFIDGHADDHHWRWYDPSRQGEPIEVWRSDQGATFDAEMCCPSLETVLQVTRHFCEYGTLDPALSWRQE